MELIFRSQYRDYPPERILLQLPHGQRAFIGRAAGVELRLSSDMIGRRHCAIEREGEELILMDLHSSNGTYLNGSRIERSPLTPGDQIQLGEHRLTLLSEWEEHTPTKEELRESLHSTNPELLWSLARKHWDLALGVAQNMYAPSEALEWLSRSMRGELRSFVARNPSAPPKALVSLLYEMADEVIENPAFALHLLENPGMLSNLGWYGLERLQEHPDPKIRELVKLLL